ncbi:hypothetical protein GCM10009007_09310 [Formosimonas limnophila]|uniref:Nitrogen fixation protein FixH n=1 Tax=Formosimonas limnophila TaxID=1384487 RepID=A0A8J3G085_9BURK|nr:FixH family protein [Formosimonas limnophila]GHA70645.1 hypothetical protein GCM10009007_09310 [Formosimonas limnophila]
MNAHAKDPSFKPWYRSRWAWFVFALPIIVVVASFLTLSIAIVSDDGVVATDYYKKGLSVNQDLTRDQYARDIGLIGQLTVKGTQLELRLSANDATGIAGQPLNLSAQNYASKTEDQTIVLLPRGDGLWYGQLAEPLGIGRWQLYIESTQWRLQSETGGEPKAPLVFKAGT